jgi:uncharacterized coiled-coil protein SlyX
VSPKEQAERIQSLAEREALQLVDTIEELDVSVAANGRATSARRRRT